MTKKLITKRLELALSSVQKFVTSGKRRVRGFASTDALDRQGDVVVPSGGKWALPLPLLREHRHDSPIGWVRDVEVRGAGLWVEVEFAEGVGQADEVWSLVEAGLVDSYSIGFIGTKAEKLSNGGNRFTQWELLEVCVVSVPANPNAKIQRSLPDGCIRLSAWSELKSDQVSQPKQIMNGIPLVR